MSPFKEGTSLMIVPVMSSCAAGPAGTGTPVAGSIAGAEGGKGSTMLLMMKLSPFFSGSRALASLLMSSITWDKLTES